VANLVKRLSSSPVAKKSKTKSGKEKAAVAYLACTNWTVKEGDVKKLEAHAKKLKGHAGHAVCVQVLEAWKAKEVGDTVHVADAGETGGPGQRAASYKNDHGGSGGKASWILWQALDRSFVQQDFVPVLSVQTGMDGKKDITCSEEAELYVYALGHAVGCFDVGKQDGRLAPPPPLHHNT
jgi:hypothetical protein